MDKKRKLQMYMAVAGAKAQGGGVLPAYQWLFRNNFNDDYGSNPIINTNGISFVADRNGNANSAIQTSASTANTITTNKVDLSDSLQASYEFYMSGSPTFSILFETYIYDGQTTNGILVANQQTALIVYDYQGGTSNQRSYTIPTGTTFVKASIAINRVDNSCIVKFNDSIATPYSTLIQVTTYNRYMPNAKIMLFNRNGGYLYTGLFDDFKIYKAII